MSATGCRASRRGAPGPQGALRPLGLRSGTAALRFGSLSLHTVETLPRGRLPTALRSRRRRSANVSIRRLPEVSTIPPCRAPSALAPGVQTLPQGRLRKPSAHHPDGLARYGFRCTESSCRPLGRGGEPLATARSRRVMDRSLRLAPITKEAPIAHRRSRPLEVSACCGNLPSTCPASCSPWCGTAACTALSRA